jgi:hypothetical protein
MPTRREFLTGLALAPLAVNLPGVQRDSTLQAEIWLEDHCLSEESALGFQRLLGRDSVVADSSRLSRHSSSLIIVPGVKRLSLASGAQLLERICGGAWVLLESGVGFSSKTESGHQAGVCERVFDLKLLPPIKVANHPEKIAYVEYTRPVRRLVRSFESVTPVCCDMGEVIAQFGSHTVCARRTIGNGGLVYLGSMLGPGLFAEEREAFAVGSVLVASALNRPLSLGAASVLIQPTFCPGIETPS